MKRLLSKEFRMRTKSVSALFLSTLIAFSTIGMGAIQSRAEESGGTNSNNIELHNPRIIYNYRDTVTFGHYWQEDTNNDGIADQNDNKQPIVWQVLEKYEDGTALVISDKVLDAKIYYTGKSNGGSGTDYACTWATSDMRKWLNDDFYNSAFSSSEHNAIKNERLVNEDNPFYSTDNGSNTNDNVFLLAFNDVKMTSRGFDTNNDNNDMSRTVFATSYATQQGVPSGRDGTVNWWLRTPGQNSHSAVTVTDTGYVNKSGNEVNIISGVRPVLRINLSDSSVNKGEKAKVSVKGCKWDTITFGKYNGHDLIWRVINVSGNDAFLLADKIILSKAYNDTGDNITWKDCTLRNWLNNDFYNGAFSEKEKSIIKTTYLENEDNFNYLTEGGDDTSDRIFLLTLSDVVREEYGFHYMYYPLANTRIAYNFDGNADIWWLRTPGNQENNVAYVKDNGFVEIWGWRVTHSTGVRPALHIDLSSPSILKEGGNITVGEISEIDDEQPKNGDGKTNDNSSEGTSNTNNASSNTSSDNKGIKKNQTITGIKNITKPYSTKKFMLKAKTNGDGKLTYQSSNNKVAKISANGKVTLIGSGKTKITVKAAATSNYKAAQKTIILTVKSGKQKITSKVKSKTMEYTSKPFYLGTKVLGKAKVTYKSSNPNVLKVDSKGKVTLTGIGKATIIIKTKKNNKYADGTKKITINVTAPKLNLKCNPLPGKKVALSWKASPVYDGYYVEIAYDSQFKDTVRGGVGNFNKGRSEAVISGFKTAGTKCYARIRPYSRVNGKEVYYSWSNTATFTVLE